MANETYVTVVGNLTADPEIRFTPSGSAVANFTIASTARKFNRQSNEWEDKTTRFWNCSAWNAGKLTLAENVVETLKKGDKVLAYGEIEPRDFETREGEKRSVVELRIESIGKNLTFHKATAQGGASQQPPAHQNGGYGVPQSNQSAPPQQGGGWGAPPQHGNGGGWGNQPPQQQPNAPQNGAQQNAPQQGNPQQQGGGWNAPAADPWSNQPAQNGGWGNPQ